MMLQSIGGYSGLRGEVCITKNTILRFKATYSLKNCIGLLLNRQEVEHFQGLSEPFFLGGLVL